MSWCTFCDIVSGKKDDYVIWQNDEFMAFLEIEPAHPGHCMLIPKKHVDYLFDLEDQLYLEMFRHAKELAIPLRRVTGAKRIGIAVVGFSMPHAHLHLMPLHNENEMFDQRLFKTAKPSELKEMQTKLLEAFKQNG